MSLGKWSLLVFIAVSGVVACSSPAPSTGCTEGAVDTTTPCEVTCGGVAQHPVCHQGVFSCSYGCDAGPPVDASGPMAPDSSVDPELIACGSQMCSGAASEYCLVVSQTMDGSATPSQTYQCTTIPVFCTPTTTCACVLDFSACDAVPGATPACVAENGNVKITCSK